MNHDQKLRFDLFYQQHINKLTFQGKRPSTIDAYSRALWRIAHYFLDLRKT